MTNTTLTGFFETTVARYGDRMAVEMRPRYRTIRWTYRDLGRCVRRLSRHLETLNVGPGDRVLLYALNSPYWMAAYFAILARGAIVVPLNPQSTPKQLDGIMASSQPKLLIKSSRILWPASEIQTVDIQHVIEDLQPVPLDDEPLPMPPTSADDLAEIVYTSGTTGEPKGVMLTHMNLLSNLVALMNAEPMDRDARLLSIIPLFHMYGQMTSMLYPLASGACVTYLPTLGSKVILESFHYGHFTHLTAVPEFLKTLMDRLELKLKQKKLEWVLHSRVIAALPFDLRRALLAPIRAGISSSLRIISSGGAPLDPEIEQKWRTLGFIVLQGYGLTETSPILAMNTRRASRVGSVGKLLPGVEMKISDAGELLVRGPNVMQGYYRDEARTTAAFEDGWFKTDDGASVSKDGFLHIFGRRKYMIVGGGGEKVFPEDIETELDKIDGIRESAVVGVKKDGRTIIHAVLLTDRKDPEQAVIMANKHLAPHQQIIAWSVWPDADFPRSATRKVKKEEVISWLEGHKTNSQTTAASGNVTPFVRLLAQVTKQNPGTIHGDMKIVPDLHLDSLLRIELVSQIEEEFGVDIEEKSITPTTTVAELEHAVTTQSKGAPRITRYPRWSNWRFFRDIRPLIQWIVLFSWLRMYIRVKLEGLEHLKNAEGPYLFMPTHVSYIDPSVVLQAIPARIRRDTAIAAGIVVLYKQFKWASWATDLVVNSYPFPTEADENIKPGLEYTGRLLDDRCHVIIFPEGRILESDAPMNHLKAGAGVIACEMDATVIPMAIIGLQDIVKPTQIWPRKHGEVIVRMGEPLRFRYTDSYAETTQKIEAAMLALVEQKS